MNKNFTKQELIKKNETNVKSATSAFVLAGVLGLIYIVRFFITKNLDFYFSLTSTELILRLAGNGSIPEAASFTIIAAFIAIYFIIALLAVKNPRKLPLALGLYIIDFLCFIPLFIFHEDIKPELFIDIIVHIFVLIFLVAGIISSAALRKNSVGSQN